MLKLKNFFFLEISNDIVNFLFIINDFQVVRTRNRSVDAKNRRQMQFETFTYKKIFFFEKIKMKTNEKMNSIIKRIIQRTDSALDRKRNKKRDRRRDRDRTRAKTRTTTRAKIRIENEKIEMSEMITNETDEMDQNHTNEKIISKTDFAA